MLGAAGEVADDPAVHRVVAAVVVPRAVLGDVAGGGDDVVEGVVGVADRGHAVVDHPVTHLAVDAGEIVGRQGVDRPIRNRQRLRLAVPCVHLPHN